MTMTSPRSDRPQGAPAEGAASPRRPPAKMPPLGGVGGSSIRRQPGPPIWGPYTGLTISNSRKIPAIAPEARRRGRQALVRPRASFWHHGGSARTQLDRLWQLPAREPATFPGRAPGPPTRPRRYGPAPLTSAPRGRGEAGGPCPCAARAPRRSLKGWARKPRQLGRRMARASGGRLDAAKPSAAVLARLTRSCGHLAARTLGTVEACAGAAMHAQPVICSFLAQRNLEDQIT